MSTNPFSPTIPKSHDNQLTWEGLAGAAQTLAIASLAQAEKKPLLLITPDVHTAEICHRELQFFTQDTNLKLHLFPDPETLPYDHFSAHEDLTSDRLRVLYHLPKLINGIVITAITTLMHRLPPTHFVEANSFVWKTGDKLNLTDMQNQLAKNGYQHVGEVMQHGEFAVRGAIIDIFPMGSDTPFRIDLFDDEIDTIRSFDPETQKSIEKTPRIDLLPAHEYPLDDEGITHFRQQWRALFPGNPAESPVYQQISQGQPIGGIESYMPLFFDQTATLLDYLPENTTLILFANTAQKAENFWADIEHRYEQYRHDRMRPLCTPDSVFCPVNQLFADAKRFTQIRLSSSTTTLPDCQVDHRKKNPLTRLENYIATNPSRLLICAESTGRREIILDLFKKQKINVSLVQNWQHFLNSDDQIGLTVAPINNPLVLNDPPITLLTEAQLFAQFVSQARREKKRAQDPNMLIKSLAELQIGARVVHIDHGVGEYIGLEKIATDEVESEYLTLAYADGDRIYVPVDALHLINRYSGADEKQVALNKLGSNQWKRAKQKAAKQIRDVAAELLKIYSERAARPGHAFAKPDEIFFKFKEAFPFEETIDQHQSVAAVIQDMTSNQSMDRLVCGDVGFGKTEVAMQAAFLATQDNKQVAMLVPTTLLANQHYQNFCDRFADWPIKIAVLSRLQSAKIQKQTIDELKLGKIDIIISTHKLLGEQIKFKDLGLLIVDEEHRFGVRQKERIKALRAHVDILTLTATPIPRTLNQSMSGVRDLSIIATPPAKRLSIKTFVHDFNHSLIREAVMREILRGGQVYFLHNDVKNMPGFVNTLKGILPEISIRYAHGQMPEKQLEQTMSDFYHQRFQVLVASTIIESGIDIPSANTIIINNANQFGLAQLHQIRGRVGRSHHQAYAYLLVKDKKALTKDAEKRLDAISELEDLGVGFQLATHDLEIRGAGELLGEAQSGHMHAIGFSLYMELLDEAVAALKTGKEPPTDIERETGPDINLHISALLPESFIADVHIRLMLYKRLSSCESFEDIQALKSEVIDRFGLLPDSAQHLFSIAALKLRAQNLGIAKIDVRKDQGFIYFCEKPNIDPKIIIDLIQKEYKTYQLQGASTLKFTVSNSEAAAKIEQIDKIISRFE